ncbi:MAG: hypothetical protein V4489_01985 [Chlamydiota bacterium]
MNLSNNKNPLDLTAGTATALSTAFAFYAFNAASKSETTTGMLFHTTLGLLGCKYAYGFASSWGKNTETTTKEQFFSKAFEDAEIIQTNTIGKVSNLYKATVSSVPNKTDSQNPENT